MTSLPRITRSAAPPAAGMVHLGPGAFFRAFIAPYTDEAMGAGSANGEDWGIIAVSLKSPTAREALVPQGCVYTALERGPEGDTLRQVEAITDVLVAPEDPRAVLDVLTQPEIRIVSLTVTEKGYCHNPRNGSLRTDHPDIAHDIATNDTPRTALGFLVLALSRRREAGIPPFTVLCCDNLPANGVMLRQLVTELAGQLDSAGTSDGLAKWIETHVAFPSTMVDRITPATTAADLEDFATISGSYDSALVIHEPFRQWVIEDDFPQGRPGWHLAGVKMVADVERHELMKLRCLNGTHSALAYLGYLAGYQTISDVVGDPAFTRLCEKLWQDEILPTVPEPEDEDLQAYCAALLVRYRNPAIQHRTWQIAMDGSQKLPQRILDTLRDNLAAGRMPRGLCLVIASWIRYVAGTDEAGQPIDVRDPMADYLKLAANSADPVTALLSIEAIFGPDLAGNADVVAAIQSAYQHLLDDGAAKTVMAYLEQPALI
jgi:fructuronate reductase